MLTAKSTSNLNHCNTDGYTPLHLACLADKPDCVKALLLAGADTNKMARGAGTSYSKSIPSSKFGPPTRGLDCTRLTIIYFTNDFCFDLCFYFFFTKACTDGKWLFNNLSIFCPWCRAAFLILVLFIYIWFLSFPLFHRPFIHLLMNYASNVSRFNVYCTYWTIPAHILPNWYNRRRTFFYR